MNTCWSTFGDHTYLNVLLCNFSNQSPIMLCLSWLLFVRSHNLECSNMYNCQMHLRINLWVHVSFNKHDCNIYSILTHAQSSMFWFSFSSNVFRRHNITVLSDEIYSRIRYDQNHVSLAKVRILHNTEWLAVKWWKILLKRRKTWIKQPIKYTTKLGGLRDICSSSSTSTSESDK